MAQARAVEACSLAQSAYAAIRVPVGLTANRAAVAPGKKVLPTAVSGLRSFRCQALLACDEDHPTAICQSIHDLSKRFAIAPFYVNERQSFMRSEWAQPCCESFRS